MSEREPSPQTIATLDKLDATNWFEFVGQREFDDVYEIGSWSEASDCACSQLSKDFRNERGNFLSETIHGRNKKRFQEWNETVKVVRPFVLGLFRDKCDPIVQLHKLPEGVINSIRWDILHLCMESEYADVAEPGYFHATAFFFTKGHFPCGVVKENGKLRRAVF